VEIAQAQADVRRVYRSGSVGQVASGVVWLVGGALATWVSDAAGMAALFLGGAAIFALTTLGLRLLGGPSALPKGHPMNSLAFQIAMTVPLGVLVVIVLARDDPSLFFPGAMVIVGAHYLPFVFLYGLPAFAALGGALVVGATGVLYLAPDAGVGAAWATGVLLVAVGLVLPRTPVSRHRAPAGERADPR
jgi:hypothetical protein